MHHTFYKAPRKLQAAIIGVSGYGRVHYDLLKKQREHGNVEIAAAVIINPDEVGDVISELKEMGCQIYVDRMDMLNDFDGKLDFICIPTGIGWHSHMVQEAFDIGANALVEKPMTATIQDARAIRNREQDTGLWASVGFQDIYSPETMRIKEMILDELVGEILEIRGYGLWPRCVSYYKRNTWAGHLKDESGWVLDSPISNALAHFLNLMLFFAGPDLESSSCVKTMEAEIYRSKPLPSFDTACLRMTNESGVQMTFTASHSAAKKLDPEIKILGSKGKIIWRMCHPHTVAIGGHKVDYIACTPLHHARDIMMERVIQRHFNPDTFICNSSHGEAHVAAINAALESSPIHDVDENYVFALNTEQDPLHALQHLELNTLICYHNGGMLHESGCGWTQPPARLVNMEELVAFSGGIGHLDEKVVPADARPG